MPNRQSVEYLLVADFDIDKGPTVSHQYPEALSSDVKQLAELMLPDQTHVRAEDWTIFFLHFTPTSRERPVLDEEPLEEPEEPSLMYVLNLVNTKHDKELKRGAQVKALAIVTRHTFLHIYKPILLLALDEYFRSPTVETLATLFESVNAMDLSGMPKLNQIERLILLQSDRMDLFSERFPQGQRERAISTSSQITHPDALESTFLDTTTPVLKPLTPGLRDTHFYNTSVLYNGTTIPIAVPLTSLPEIVGDFSVIQLINTFSKIGNPPQTFPQHPELTTSGPHTHPIIILLNAMLTQKRVVILGRAQPSGQVASQVLAACAMISGGSGVLRGFTERAFPYTDLSKIDDLLTVDGFIAGVTNSVFELHPEWWDLLCNVDTGTMTISPNLKAGDSFANPLASPSLTVNTASSASSAPTNMSQQPPSGGALSIDPYDAAFIEDLMHSIADRNSESTIRLKFRTWTTRFLKLATSYAAEFPRENPTLHALTPSPPTSFRLPGLGHTWPDASSKSRDLAINEARIARWTGTRSFHLAVMDRTSQYARHSVRVKSLDLDFQLDRLRSQTLSLASSGTLFVTLNQEIVSDIHVLEFLALMPMSSGGLSIVAAGLFHPDVDCRRAVVELLERVREHEVGRWYFAAMNMYFRLAHERLSVDLNRGSIGGVVRYGSGSGSSSGAGGES